MVVFFIFVSFPEGSYIYVEASNGVVGPVRLFSRTITPTHVNMCLKFWYFMYGRDVANLRVYIFTGTRFNRNMNPHWRKSGSQQEKWLLGKIFFQMKQTFHVRYLFFFHCPQTFPPVSSHLCMSVCSSFFFLSRPTRLYLSLSRPRRLWQSLFTPLAV